MSKISKKGSSKAEKKGGASKNEKKGGGTKSQKSDKTGVSKTDKSGASKKGGGERSARLYGSTYGQPKRSAKVSWREPSRGNESAAQSSYYKAPPSKKLKIVLIVAIVAILFTLLVGVILYFALKQTATNVTTTEAEWKAITPTASCQEASKSKCWYSKEKFIDCNETTCYSLTLAPKLIEDSSYTKRGLKSYRLMFTYDENPTQVKPIDNTYCEYKGRGYGRCEKGRCRVYSTHGKIVKRFNATDPTHGGWEKSSECISDLTTPEEANSLKWAEYLKRTECVVTDDCNKYRATFRSCINPAPDFGNVCWDKPGEDGRLALDGDKWPIQIYDTDMCTECQISERPLDCSPQSIMDKCAFHTDDFNLVNQQTDFRNCCVTEGRRPDLLIGKCFLGTCIPPTT